MKLAIVHDYLNQFGGAERVVAALHELYPDAPIYTSIYNPRALPDIFQRMDIRTSFMQKLPLVFPLFRWYLFFYPLAFESFDLDELDVVISSSSAFAKGCKKRPGQVHICYCYTPMRFVWRLEEYIEKENWPAWFKKALPYFLKPIRKWDLATARNVDSFIAISRTVADRILRVYGRQSEIIYPPVETEAFRPGASDGDYFLVVSRLNAYKHLDLVIEAFKRLDLPLKIVGAGPERKQLQAMAGEQTAFLGQVSDSQLAGLLAECRALIFPGEEDFGIAPIEAMSCGRPVIAFQAGGAAETVVAGKTGKFFFPQTAEALIKAVESFLFEYYDKEAVRQHARTFSKEIFMAKIRKIVEQKQMERKL